MSFQELIKSLDSFWAKQGCLLGQPYGVELGAGTGNPHTFFRVLGPEPFNVAYVEPSRRPTDGRYGQSPNRFQHYFQYQVILKPAPKFNQELFIESLIVLGLDPKKHDIRFVEDNWESTPLGAWGLGWEIWCDGMEIAQYTYFQQMAGTPLEVPTLEITYGLERLAMYIQDVDDYHDLKWNDTTTYADIFERHEYWQAIHNFKTSTPETLRTLYSTYEREVQTQLDHKNFWSAYDYLLKVSHIFNLLDARGMISVSDRVAKFGMMGKATKAISTQYLEERKALGYPLKNRMMPITYRPKVNEVISHVKIGQNKYQKNIAIVELGFEELPASYLVDWTEILTHTWFKKKLKEYGVTYRKAYLYVTPRRLVLKVVQPSKTGRVVQLIKGPAAHIAYDDSGKPTQVLEGFMKKNELTKNQIVIKQDQNGKNIVTAEKIITKTLTEVFQTISENILSTAPKTKWMVWETGLPAFIRPLRWILAFHNDKRLLLSLMHITTGKTSPVPRYETPAEEKISSAQQYLRFIRASGIILSQKKRMRRIAKESRHPGEKIGKFEDMVIKNSFLTENPHALAIKLEKKYSELPKELITLILEKNQMYPLTEEKNGTLWYHVVANHKRVHKRIEHGNQKVAKARLDDGLFYFQQDGKKKLRDFGDGLKNIGFHPKAGSYFDKKMRIQQLVKEIYSKLGGAVPAQVFQALELLKNDKATSLGKEFPSLEGIIGKAYAEREGLNTKVSLLLTEHYLPTEPNGKIPTTHEGKIISLADKLDSLITLTEVEKLPEGNHDPFEIRKTVYRLVTLLRTMPEIDLADFVENNALLKYIAVRFELQLIDEGIPQWIAHNVALGTSSNYAKKCEYAGKLSNLNTDDARKNEITDTFKRVNNILAKNKIEKQNREVTEYTKDTNIEGAEKKLLTYLTTHESQILPEQIPELSEILHNFFDTVTILTEDAKIRQRRFDLLAAVRSKIQEYFAISFS
ncbi:glycine--tRNA ligase subunit alpha [bacterium]|nr:glycine--tRNA ligase subunit alpha [bacterium]